MTTRVDVPYIQAHIHGLSSRSVLYLDDSLTVLREEAVVSRTDSNADSNPSRDERHDPDHLARLHARAGRWWMPADYLPGPTDQKVGSSNLPGCASVSPSQGAKDVTGNLPKVIEEFNKQHPRARSPCMNCPMQLTSSGNRWSRTQNTQIKNDKMAVLSVDNVWTAEFAANQWIIPLPEDKFPTSEFLKSAVNSATYFDKMYAYPYQTDGGLLYYRKDLLDKYGLKPPTTWGN